MKNWSIYLLYVELKKLSQTLVGISYSFRSLISSPTSWILVLELPYCSGGDLVITKISRSGSCEKISKIRHVLPEKDGPTKSVRLFKHSSFTGNFSEILLNFFLHFIVTVFTYSSIFLIILFIQFYVTCSTIYILIHLQYRTMHMLKKQNRTIYIQQNSSRLKFNLLLLKRFNFIFMFIFIEKIHFSLHPNTL